MSAPIVSCHAVLVVEPPGTWPEEVGESLQLMLFTLFRDRPMPPPTYGVTLSAILTGMS